MEGPLRFAEYLAQYPPGPELAVALGRIDPADLSGHDAVWYMRAENRQLAHQQWRLRRSVAVVSRAEPDGGRMAGPDEWSAHEVKAALGLTRFHANKLVTEAWDITEGCPEIGAAMADGELDWPRAEKLLEVTAGLSDAVTASVVTTMLPRAALSAPKPETTGQIAEAAAELAIALDPSYAKTKYDSAVRERKIVASRNPDGTANLAGHNLPPEHVQAGSNRIDTLAKARKRAGDPRPINHLRVEIYRCLLDGTWAGLDDQGILAALAATAPRADGTQPDPGASRPLDGVELRLRLTTALGADRFPGELAGYGPLHAEGALHVLATLGAAQWRWVLLDENNRLLRTGLIRTRPGGASPRAGTCASIVDLHIRQDTLDLLAQAAADPHADPPLDIDPELWAGWRPFVADLAERAARESDPPCDPERRFADAKLRREVQTALSRCIGVGCRVPASRTDLDHTRDKAKGGKTTRINNGPACRYDHRVKHEGGWTLERIQHGYRWISRLRHVYDVLDPPVSRDLPDPVPGGIDWDPQPDPPADTDNLGRHWEQSGVWEYDGEEAPPF